MKRCARDLCRGGIRLPLRSAARAGRVQLQRLPVHIWTGFSLRVVPGGLSTIAQTGGRHMEQRGDRAALRGDLDRDRYACGLWALEAPQPGVGRPLYLSLVTPEIVTGISLLAFFQWLFVRCICNLGIYTVVICACGILDRVRRDRGVRAAAHLDPRSKRPRSILGRHEWRAFFRVTLPALCPGSSPPVCWH